MTETPSIDSDIHNLDRYLGSPSSQKVLQLLTCWETLSVKEIALKAALSESQVHVTLNRLEKLDLVVKQAWGKYSFSNSKFASLLKTAYSAILEQIIGNEIYQLTKQMDNIPRETLEAQYSKIVDQWGPLLSAKFSFQMNELAGFFVEFEQYFT
ncbi:MAG TPA: hypothetical protein VKK79_09660 [Candidatus Lokiarchaeia archaeon]|nr:hypothetical protein [Candidatus Lokiarchaeia archaeon]